MILDKIFDAKTMEKIAKIVDNPINQVDKADKYKKLLKERGAKQLDMGTNRQIYIHDDYPKAVFKVALDEQGVLDNLNEFEKSDKSKFFPQSFDIDRDGLILVQQRTPVIDLDFFRKKETQKRVRDMLKKLDEQGFILLDLGSDKHKNYGMDKNGNIFILDFGYVEYKSLANFNCPHVRIGKNEKKKSCKGHLEYNKNFTMVQCTECEDLFRIDVVMEGYTHEMYAQPPKEKDFEPSDELEKFYKQFNKSRDRSTLTRYVELSNKSEAEKGETTMNTFKDKFLAKSQGLTTKPLVEQVQASLAPEQRRHVNRRKEPDEIYNASSNPTVIHDDDVMDEVEEEMQDTEFASAAKRLTELGISEEDADNIISTLFYKRFPEVRIIIDEFKARRDGDINRGADVWVPDANINYTDVCREAGIVINAPSGGLVNELHIGMVAEELKKRPIIVISKNGVVYYIDLLEHIDRLIQFVNEDDQGDKIVTSMVAETVSKFLSKDYDSRYFTDEPDSV